MSFEAPALLATLVVVPLAALGYWLLQRRRPRYAVRYTNVGVLAAVAGRTVTAVAAVAPSVPQSVPVELQLHALCSRGTR